MTFDYGKLIKARPGRPSRDHYYTTTWNQIVMMEDTDEIITLSDESIHDNLKNAEVRAVHMSRLCVFRSLSFFEQVIR